MEVVDQTNQPQGQPDQGFEARLKAELLTSSSIKEMDYARAVRVARDTAGEESLVSLLIRLGMVSDRIMAESLARVESLRLLKTRAPAPGNRGWGPPRQAQFDPPFHRRVRPSDP